MRRRTAGGASRVVPLLVVGVLLSGCGSDGYEPSGPFRPLPEGPPPQVGPPSSSAPRPGQPAEPGAGSEGGDPNVVASGLAVPIGLAVLPDGSAVVGERDTGRLLQVFPDRAPAKELMTLPGLDTSGDGGLLGLAVSPTYPEDGLFYAYVTTATDNRVVRFPIGGTPNPVLTGIPRGAVHNGGGLAFGTQGELYVGTGDTGNPALSGDPASLGGKVLRIDVFGGAPGGDPVYSRGHRDVTALCVAGEGLVYATDDALDGPDEVNAIAGGANYGPEGPGAVGPLVDFPAEEGGLGGCAAAPNVVFLGALDGERVHVVQLDDSGAVVDEPLEFLGGQYGRLRSVAIDVEGALWVTTSNRDGVGTPDEDDDKVLRVLPPTSASNSPL